MPFKQSIRTQLVLWNTLTMAALFILMGVVLHYSVSVILATAVDRELRERTQHIVEFPPPPPLRDDPLPGPGQPPGPDGDGPPDPNRPPPRPRHGNPFSRDRDGRLADYRPRLINPQGRIMKPDDVQAPWDASAVERAFQGQIVYSTIWRGKEPLRVLSRRFPDTEPAMGVVQDVFSLAENTRILNTLDRALLLVLPLSLLCAATGSALSTRRTLSQIRSFTESAKKLTAHDLSRRLPVSGQDEFATLSATFNDMIERLEISFDEQKTLIGHLQQLVEQQRRFTADASHELRTPLTAIKANTSLLLSPEWTPNFASDQNRPLVEDIDQAATAMAHLVNDLLLLARSDEGQLGHNRQNISLKKTIENAVALATSGKSELPTLQIQCPESEDVLPLYANEMELTRLLTNLIVNALHYTPSQGHISISAVRENNVAHIKVADSGIGIAPQHLPHLGERFFRVETARSRSAGGTGLGLSICKSIAASHGGSLSFESTLGLGTTVTVTLPLNTKASTLGPVA